MSVTPQHKLLRVASAASLSAMGFLIVPASVAASPMVPLDPAVPCDSYTFPANLNIKQGDGTLVIISNAAGGQLNGAPASYTVGGKTTTGTGSGGSTGGESLDFTLTWNSGPGNGSSNHYTGVVTKTGTAQGMSVSNKGPQTAWSSAPMTFGCVAPAPVVSNPVVPPPVVPPPPQTAPANPVTVKPQQKNSSLDFAVTNTGTVDLQCTYTATKKSGLDWLGAPSQNFALKAGATHNLDLPGLPIKTSYDVSISCKGPDVGTAFSQVFSG